MKSSLTPLTPQPAHLRAVASSKPQALRHRRMPTLRWAAYFTSSGTRSSHAGQPSSTSTYSQPISWAKSTNFVCASKLLGLLLSDHHDHATRPGLIQEVSASVEGGLRF